MNRDIITLRTRRAVCFTRVVARFDLMSFSDIADGLAREPGRLERNEKRRELALADLREAALRGEFGPPDKPAIVCLPENVPSDRRGRLPLRMTAGQISLM